METEGFYMAEKRWRSWETVGLLVVLFLISKFVMTTH